MNAPVQWFAFPADEVWEAYFVMVSARAEFVVSGEGHWSRRWVVRCAMMPGECWFRTLRGAKRGAEWWAAQMEAAS